MAEYYLNAPLEVFALDSDMNRMTGSIPYTSLIWDRCYYEPGQFSMTVRSDLYDQDWAFIYCEDRPETGMVQKVEYEDSGDSGGGDTITISGFFLEAMLGWTTFLVEQAEEEVIEVERPRNGNNITQRFSKPYVYTDTKTGKLVYKDVSTGEYKDNDGNVLAGDASRYESVDYEYNGKVHEGSVELADGSRADGVYLDSRGYYTTDGGETITAVGYGAYDTPDPGQSYDVALKTQGVYFYQKQSVDGRTITVAVTGVTESKESTYIGQVKAWERGPKYVTKQVKGPWQRTDVGEPETVKDSVQLVYDWVRKFWTNEMTFVETDVVGEEKAIDPSLKSLQEFVYSTLEEQEASVRIMYSFEMNQWTFEVYRGEDLTQAANAPSERSASSSLASDYPVPEGYTALEYIQGTGTQWIDTGVFPSQSTSYTIDLQIDTGNTVTSSHIMTSNGDTNFALRLTSKNDAFAVRWGTQALTTMANSGSVLDRHVISCDQGVYTIDGANGASFSYESFSRDTPLNLFCLNGTSTKVKMKLYSLSISNGGVVQRDFVPATRDSDGAVGLFDRVSATLYTSQVSDPFISGPEVQRPAPEPAPDPEPDKSAGRWCVFSSEWGTMSGYTASLDDSAYRNTCFVLYEYDEPKSFDDDGYPNVEAVIGEVQSDSSTEGSTTGVIGYEVPYTTRRGYYEVTVGDDTEPRKEVYLDQRDVDPSCDQEWPRDTIEWSATETPTKEELGLTKCRDIYEGYPQTLKDAGTNELKTNWGSVYNLDTGTISTKGYIREYDLGDVVDWGVERLGIMKEGRIVEVQESYESSGSNGVSINVNLTIGDELVTLAKKIKRGQ